MAEDYTIQDGDSVVSVAYERGFFWQTLWNDGANAALKDLRKDPDILLPGDVLHIPDKTIKKDPAATEQKHKYKKLGSPAKFVCVLIQTGDLTKAAKEAPAKPVWDWTDPEQEPRKTEPLKNADFELYADGKLLKNGKTDGDGKLEVPLPPNAQDGLLIVRRGTPQETALELNFRQMDPINTTEGVCKRLRNLGYGCPLDSTLTTPVKMAVAAFQRDQGMTATGAVDDALRDKLKTAYGG